MVMSNAVQTLAKEHYISLETYRRNGRAIPTPVWFIEQNGKLYVSAPSHTGKVKRIRNNGQVRIAPCDGRGNVTGQWLDGQARFVEGAQADAADRLLTRKYGWQKRALELFGSFKRWRYTIIEIQA
jgi:uncharacterized protein